MLFFLGVVLFGLSLDAPPSAARLSYPDLTDPDSATFVRLSFHHTLLSSSASTSTSLIYPPFTMDTAAVRSLLATSLDPDADSRRRAEIQLKQVRLAFASLC